MNGYINVKQYGAVGNGIVDDTAAISFCLANFEKIYFPTGIYNTTSLELLSNRSLLGDGGELSQLRNITPTEAHYIVSDKKINITIESMYLNGNMVGRLTGGLNAKTGSTYQFSNTDMVKDVRQNNIVIKNCVISGNGFNNLGSINAHNVLIDGCTFINGRDSGVAATTGCSKWIVVNCNFDNTLMFPISFSNNGVSETNYNLVDQCRDSIIANNIIDVGKNLNPEGVTINGRGIELDGCRNMVVSNNIIKITQDGLAGIRLVGSGVTGKGFDCNNINIIGNSIVSNSTIGSAGIELNNSVLDNAAKQIRVSNNHIRNEITNSNFTAIGIYNLSKIIIENNIISAGVISGTSQTFKIGINLEPNISNAAMDVDVNFNDINGATTVGIQTLASSTKQVASFSGNKVYGNTYNISINGGWEIRTDNNYFPTPNYFGPPRAIHGDFRYYTAAPTSGDWLKNELVYNSNPSGGAYIGWVCITAGSPGTWKGFGLIQV